MFISLKSLRITLVLILFSSSFLLLISCSNDDGPGLAFDFIDQNLQGTIDGISFTLGEGRAEESISNSEELSINLYDISEDIDDPCDFNFFGEHVRVVFTIPNAVGLYELGDTDEDLARTVTLLNPSGPTNIIALDGAVELLTITSSEVTGRIDARSGSDAVNGNFVVPICIE